MKLPEWTVIDRKMQVGAPLNPLEALIHDNEPAGIARGAMFRKELSDALDFVWNLASTSAKGGK